MRIYANESFRGNLPTSHPTQIVIAQKLLKLWPTPFLNCDQHADKKAPEHPRQALLFLPAHLLPLRLRQTFKSQPGVSTWTGKQHPIQDPICSDIRSDTWSIAHLFPLRPHQTFKSDLRSQMAFSSKWPFDIQADDDSLELSGGEQNPKVGKQYLNSKLINFLFSHHNTFHCKCEGASELER